MGKIIKDIDGLPVFDAKRGMKLIVNKNDVDKADIKEPKDCAVARACRRKLHAKEVRVHLSRIYVKTNEGSWTRYFTPRAMRSEIIAFDRGGKFEAGEYHLLPPHPSNRLGKNKSRGPHLKKGKKRTKPHIIKDVRAGPA